MTAITPAVRDAGSALTDNLDGLNNILGSVRDTVALAIAETATDGQTPAHIDALYHLVSAAQRLQTLSDEVESARADLDNTFQCYAHAAAEIEASKPQYPPPAHYTPTDAIRQGSD